MILFVKYLSFCLLFQSPRICLLMHCNIEKYLVWCTECLTTQFIGTKKSDEGKINLYSNNFYTSTSALLEEKKKHWSSKYEPQWKWTTKIMKYGIVSWVLNKNNHSWSYTFYSLIILLESVLLLSSSPLKNGISLKKSTQIIAATAFSTEEIELRVDEYIIK